MTNYPNFQFQIDDTKQRNFQIELFEIGDTKSCLYSYFCCPCALAESRTYLDGSQFEFNLFCLQLIPYRWMVRSAYEIGDTDIARHDWLIGICTPCCAVNQIYQTTKAYKNPTSRGGRLNNTNDWIKEPPFIKCDTLASICCCYPCTVATTLKESIGMPTSLGCFCLTCNICLLRNIIRYQYRLKPDEDDMTDDCIFPSLFCCLISPIVLIMPCLMPCYFFPVFVTGYCGTCLSSVTKIFHQANQGAQRQFNIKRGYLRGYHTPEEREKIRTELINAARAVAELNPIFTSSTVPTSSSHVEVTNIGDANPYATEDFTLSMANSKLNQKVPKHSTVDNTNPYATKDFTSSIANSKLSQNNPNRTQQKVNTPDVSTSSSVTHSKINQSNPNRNQNTSNPYATKDFTSTMANNQINQSSPPTPQYTPRSNHTRNGNGSSSTNKNSKY